MECIKKGYFIDAENDIELDNKEEDFQKSIFSELKGVKDVQKKAVMFWIDLKINEYDQKQVTIPRIGLMHHSMVDRSLENIYKEFEEASKSVNTLCPNCEPDEKFIEAFIEWDEKISEIY
jgi:hypothetical protein